MTDPEIPEPTPIDAFMIAILLTDAWRKIAADPDIAPGKRIDHLALALQGVQEAASALRMVAREHVVGFSHPDAVTARAEAGKAAQARAIERSKTRARQIEKMQAERALRESFEKAARDAQAADAVTKRLEQAGDADPRDLVLARGALAEAKARLADCRAAMCDAGLADA